MSDYEHMRGESGKAEIANLLDATKIRVQDAYEMAKRTLGDMKEGSEGIREVEIALGHMESAKEWMEQAMREIEG